MRVTLLALAWLLSAGCVRAHEHERRAREHLRNELNFLVPYVDIESEEKAVRKALAQRKLVVDETLRGPGYVALSAATLDQKRTAVRIISARGIVAAEDGDQDDLFAASRVALGSLATGGPGSEMLLGIVKTERGQDRGCAQFYRVRPDASLAPLEVHIERFGSRACLAALGRDEAGTLFAQVGWPSLSAGSTPVLTVDMRVDSGRLDQPEPDHFSLRIASDESAFIARESARLAHELAGATTFRARQAVGVARAALALCANEDVDHQLAAYQGAFGKRDAIDSELVALTRTHIERGFQDQVAEPDSEVVEPGSAPDEAADTEDAVLIEPKKP
jgi:hypothetical protein